MMLNTLNEWRIFINKTKSKIVHFRKSNYARSKVFKVRPVDTEYADKYKYLGVFVHEFVDFTENKFIKSCLAIRKKCVIQLVVKKSINHLTHL